MPPVSRRLLGCASAKAGEDGPLLEWMESEHTSRIDAELRFHPYAGKENPLASHAVTHSTVEWWVVSEVGVDLAREFGVLAVAHTLNPFCQVIDPERSVPYIEEIESDGVSQCLPLITPDAPNLTSAERHSTRGLPIMHFHSKWKEVFLLPLALRLSSPPR